MTKFLVTVNLVTTGGLDIKNFQEELKTILKNSPLGIESVEVQDCEEFGNENEEFEDEEEDEEEEKKCQ